MLLLNEMRPALPGRVVIIDSCPPLERTLVHWSHRPTFYDRFAIGVWQRARVADTLSDSIVPFTLRLVRSGDVFEHLDTLLGTLPIEWMHATTLSISRCSDGLYEIVIDVGAVHAGSAFDSACEVAPTFLSPEQPKAVLS